MTLPAVRTRPIPRPLINDGFDTDESISDSLALLKAVDAEFIAYESGDPLNTFTRYTLGRPGEGENPFFVKSDPNAADEDREKVHRLEGVILHVQEYRQLREFDFIEGQSNPVVCRSIDMQVGIGEPGGACHKCPYGEWRIERSARGQERRRPPRCPNRVMVFFQNEHEMIPQFLDLPGMHLKTVKAYLGNIRKKGALMPWQVVTSFELRKEGSYSNLVLRTLATTNTENEDVVEGIRGFAPVLAEALALHGRYHLTDHYEEQQTEQPHGERPERSTPETEKVDLDTMVLDTDGNPIEDLPFDEEQPPQRESKLQRMARQRAG